MEQNNKPVTGSPSPVLQASVPYRAAAQILECLEFFVIAFAVVLLTITLVIRHSPVSGTSMYDTLDDRDILLVSDLFYTPQRGDIIVAQSQTYGFERPLVKRVIARGGDTVEIAFDTWTVKVNGEVIDEPYVTRPDNPEIPMVSYDCKSSFEVPEGYLFVMGDNRNGSYDSRGSGIGLIDERHVLGHVLFRVYPFNKFGLLEQ